MTRSTHFCAVVIEFRSRQEAASDVKSGMFVRPVVPDMLANIRYPRLNPSREIPIEAVAGGIFDGFFPQ